MKTDTESLQSAPLPQAGWEVLSLLADGQASSEQAWHALDLWARDPAGQERWQTWHLIGDVMRSADLAPAHASGDVFLPQLRARLQGQSIGQAQDASRDQLHGESPIRVPYVPAKPPNAVRSWAPWTEKVLLVARSMLARWWPPRGPLIAGGGVAASALLLVLGFTHPWEDGATSSISSLEGAKDRQVPVAAASSAGAEPVWRAADGQLIRDARLDEYLRAHRAGSPAVPGGATGRFETVVLER
ncbi:MAG: sigma-E factor negative regulatory protein [Betaproteobacteria bacterium]